MASLKDVLRRTYENLHMLQQREAKSGGAAPLELLNQLADHRQAIALLEAAVAANVTGPALAELREELRPLLIAANVNQLNLDELAAEKPRLPFEPETVLIPAGQFLMGRADADPAEAPRHPVEVAAFRLGKYPVTNAEYAAFIQQNPRLPIPVKAGWFVRQPPPDKLEHPVVGVSWFEAVAYCRWLSEQSGRDYRLPTEAEWEKAAAWDGQQSRRYPWGNDFAPERCNAAPSGLGQTSPVGRYSPGGDSFFGCADLAGNVQEWVSTRWGLDLAQSAYPYPYRPDDGRENPADSLPRGFRLYRGGSYRDEPERVRASARGQSDPDSRLRWRGFRVAEGQ
jgi:formylglycine-generating enzyme required for sulfatase activity